MPVLYHLFIFPPDTLFFRYGFFSVRIAQKGAYLDYLPICFILKIRRGMIENGKNRMGDASISKQVILAVRLSDGVRPDNDNKAYEFAKIAALAGRF